MDISVFIFSIIIFFTYINLESELHNYRSVQISVILSILKIKKISSQIIL